MNLMTKIHLLFIKPALSSRHSSDVGILTATSHSCNSPSPSHRSLLGNVSHILPSLPTAPVQAVIVSYLLYGTNFLLLLPVSGLPTQFLLYQRAGKEEYRRESIGYKSHRQNTSNSFGTKSKAMVTENKKSGRYFSSKNGFTQKNRKLQSAICNHDELHAKRLKQTRGSSFIEGKRKLGRPLQRASSVVVCDGRKAWELPLLASLLHFKEGFCLLIFYSYQLILMYVSMLCSLIKREGERFTGDPP